MSNEIIQQINRLDSHLKQYELIDSLHLVWSYFVNYDLNTPLDRSIELLPRFNPEDSNINKQLSGIRNHELEFLQKKILSNCKIISKSKSLKRKSELMHIINAIRMLNDYVEKKSINDNELFLDLNRMYHKQFPWQHSFNISGIMRYYKIFNTDESNSLIQDSTGMSAWEILILGFYFYKTSSENFKNDLNIETDTKLITEDMIHSFLDLYSMNLDECIRKIKASETKDENIFYTYNPLIEKPIIIHSKGYICPAPLLLYYRVTQGTYYLICKQNSFSRIIGSSFQSYIGEVLSCICSSLSVIAESSYYKGKNRKDTTDWFIYDSDSIVFIECKVKRMSLKSKSEIDHNIEGGLEDDLKILAKGITQIYNTFLDYSEGLYPGIQFDPGSKRFYPLILTMENWYVNFNPGVKSKLDDYVLMEFDRLGLNQELFHQYPYYIMAAEEFERDIQLMNHYGISRYFDLLRSREITSIRDHFDFQVLFEDEFKDTFVNFS
jgi:hypothetical protein